MPFPSSLRRKIRDFSLVPVVSAPVEVDPTCCYADLPHFSHFGDSISFVGGINKPKLIQCFDSAGHCHRQLVKPLLLMDLPSDMYMLLQVCMYWSNGTTKGLTLAMHSVMQQLPADRRM